ncbi:MAG: DNA polymerase I [Bacteroidota bacterium]
MKKLFLLDAMALIYRAHFAFSKTPRITSKGLNTSAVFGFTNTLLEILTKEKPTHIAVAFDSPGPTFRHVQFEQYKAHRDVQPEDITVAIPYVKKLVEAMNIPLIILEGYEADDIIGTVAKQVVRQHDDIEVFMMTPDKDYGQLVEERIKMYKPGSFGKPTEILGVKEICEKWDIKSVDQVIDMLGLMGDSADNIPGVPNVGEKTAQKLIAEYGTIENIIANADKLKGKLQENIVNFAEQGLLSKQLATIHCEVPITWDEEDLKVSEVNKEKLTDLVDELEFRTIRKRLLGEESNATNSESASQVIQKPKAAPVNTGQMDLFGANNAVSTPVKLDGEFSEQAESDNEEAPVRLEKRTIHSTVHNYHLIDSEELIKSLVKHLSVQESICFDTETTSVDAFEAELVGLSFSYYSGEAFYVNVPENRMEAQKIVELFRPVFENENIEKIAQNIKYDLMVLQNYGVEVKGKLYDTMLAHYLIEPEKRHGMDIMAENYLNYSPVSIDELIGKKGGKQGSMRDVDLNQIKEYAAEDADITLQLKKVLHPILAKNPRGVALMEELEMPLTQVLANVESEGVRIDTEALKQMSDVLATDIIGIEGKIYDLAGLKFNIASPKQLGEILFDHLKLDPKAKKTKTGQYATGEDILSKLEKDNPIIQNILDFRELQKLKSTYVDALPLLISKKDGRIHTSFNQAVAATGRLSSTNPNLQNIPIRTIRGREIRKAFIPRNEEFKIMSADYSQIELRIMAAVSGDASMTEAFNKGIDIHSTTASKVFGVELNEVTSEMRRRAKMVNFGIIYGISAFGLSQRLDIPRKEAAEIIDNYFKEFPSISQYMNNVVEEARKNTYVETIMGRRRYLRDINAQNQVERGFAERNAINAPIQGSAADMIKLAMIKIHHHLKNEKMKSKMILTVHDELVFDAYEAEISELKTIVNELMVNAMPLSVKMETGIGVGLNWLEAH